MSSRVRPWSGEAAAAAFTCRSSFERANSDGSEQKNLERASMASEELQTVNELLGALDLASGTLEERRATMDAMSQDAPAGTTVTSIDAGGVPAEWVVAPEAEANRVVMY